MRKMRTFSCERSMRPAASGPSLSGTPRSDALRACMHHACTMHAPCMLLACVHPACVHQACAVHAAYTRPAQVDAAKREIVCRYDFEAESGERASQVNPIARSMDRSVGRDAWRGTQAGRCMLPVLSHQHRARSPPPPPHPPTHQANTHYYALPDQLRAMLDAAGFEVEATFGGFGGEAYDEEESDHLIFAARLRD